MKLIKSLIENYNGTSESTLKDRINSRDNLIGFLQITAAAQSLLKGANGDAALEAGAHPEPELAAAARRRPPPAYIATEADGQSLGLFGSPGLKPAAEPAETGSLQYYSHRRG